MMQPLATTQFFKTYAVVAANTSTLLAFVMKARIKENNVVKSIMTTNLAKGRLTKYKTKIEEVGSSEDRIVLAVPAKIMRAESS